MSERASMPSALFLSYMTEVHLFQVQSDPQPCALCDFFKSIDLIYLFIYLFLLYFLHCHLSLLCPLPPSSPLLQSPPCRSYPWVLFLFCSIPLSPQSYRSSSLIGSMFVYLYTSLNGHIMFLLSFLMGKTMWGWAVTRHIFLVHQDSSGSVIKHWVCVRK